MTLISAYMYMYIELFIRRKSPGEMYGEKYPDTGVGFDPGSGGSWEWRTGGNRENNHCKKHRFTISPLHETSKWEKMNNDQFPQK